MAAADHLATAGAAPAASTSRRALILLLFLAAALFPLLHLAVGGLNYWLHMALFLFMNIAIASSWNIIGGYAGYISLGHNVFFAVGGYAAAILFAYFGVSPFIAFPLCGLIAMAVGFVVGLITLRTRGPTFIISTIALVLLVKILFDNWGYVGGTNGISLPLLDLPVEYVKLPFYYAMLVLAVGAIWLSFRVRRSKFGLGLRAISQDETKAEVAGVPTRFYKTFAFALSGLFIGMAGALWGYYLTYLSPAIFLTILVGAKFVLMTILGGRGTVSGPVVGAVVFIVANEFFVAQFGATELNIVATGLMLVLVLLFFPEGIVGTLKKTGRLPKLLDWD
ncbi:MAG: branched-chain amino acid ABC transporter permease [Bauldia sp.]|nr:MAG: branched-chain amino acid ABC transporter permease [Bauldia sp.]MBZ0228760.1 branched-chain amino acid ABC transporter permease [Bauldia sp.]